MNELERRRSFPFAIGAGVLAMVVVAAARLPESFVNGLERRSPFSFSQAAWIFRLFLAAAVIQALYSGFVRFHTDRIQSALEHDDRAAAWSREKLVGVVARNAVVVALTTLVYGIVLLGLTGLRGSFWAFPILALAQGAWYFRLVGDLARWSSFRPERPAKPAPSEWQREPPDYCPPLARGLVAARRDPA